MENGAKVVHWVPLDPDQRNRKTTFQYSQISRKTQTHIPTKAEIHKSASFPQNSFQSVPPGIVNTVSPARWQSSSFGTSERIHLSWFSWRRVFYPASAIIRADHGFAPSFSISTTSEIVVYRGLFFRQEKEAPLWGNPQAPIRTFLQIHSLILLFWSLFRAAWSRRAS
jgi:hypothetical protein